MYRTLSQSWVVAGTSSRTSTHVTRHPGTTDIVLRSGTHAVDETPSTGSTGVPEDGVLLLLKTAFDRAME